MDAETQEDLLSEKAFEEIYADDDLTSRERKLVFLRKKAKEEGRTKEFDQLRASYDRAIKEQLQREREEKKAALRGREVGMTDFSDCPYGNKICGAWQANDFGITTYDYDSFNEHRACPHPILPVERLRNIETGIEQMKVAFRRDGRWNEIIVQKDVLSSATKIIALSNRGILVNSETSKYLVKYLSEVEAYNEGGIPVQRSSSKFGWNGGLFLPYDTEIVFDGDARFSQLTEAIMEQGDYGIWLQLMRDVRRKRRYEVQMMMSASFASVLLKRLGLLSFFVDLWGETEGGKTVTLMAAASIWGDPGENRYIGDFKTTEVALETKANALNNLPMMLDDTSKVSKRIADNFEGIIYDLASGKGKSRSDKDLGVRYENNWNLSILSTGEAPLSGYANQGGAVNRILEIKCGSRLFDDPRNVAETVKRHYGHAGKQFIETVKEMGDQKIREIFQFQQERIDKAAKSKMQKQLLSLAAVLTADQIATDTIFRDGVYIDFTSALETLIAPEELSTNERAYQYLLSRISMEEAKFNPASNSLIRWGSIDSNYAYILVAAYSQILEEKQFSRKAFDDWGVKHGVIVPSSSGKPYIVKNFGNGNRQRCVKLKLQKEEEEDENELPFD